MTTVDHAISIASIQREPSEIEGPITVGKDVLDLITGAMYVEPLSIYREYVQNAADSIFLTAREPHVSNWKPRVDIAVDSKERRVTIRDNGMGISGREFVSRLTAIGASKKRGTGLRGFRGVGRLSGLGYCQELVFRSRTHGDRRVSVLSWDGRRLKDVLRETSAVVDLADAVRTIARTTTISGDGWPDAFFEVELRKVTRVRNDVLLNEEEIAGYLSQVAPIPFSPEFDYGAEITSRLRDHNINDAIAIHIANSDTPLTRPHRNQFPITEKVSDRVSGLQFIEIPSLDGGLDAIGWVLSHSYLGSIPKRAHVEGFRVRAGNMQIGGAELVAHVFPEPRFNAWCIGEFHVLNPKILPNGRRDDFEINGHYQNFLGHLGGLSKDITKLCREKSELRNRLKKAALLIDGIEYNLGLLTNSKYLDIHEFVLERTTQQIGKLEGLVETAHASPSERAFLTNRVEQLRAGARAASRKRGSRTVFMKVAPAKRKAYEDAIAVILDAALPMQVRADLVRELGLRVAESVKKRRTAR